MFRSTRGYTAVRATEALLEGLAPDGGLYVPEALPRFPPGLLETQNPSYPRLASALLSPLFPELAGPGFEEALDASASLFPANPAPLVSAAGLNFLELHRGPTLAFKDFALSLMGDLLRLSAAAEEARGARRLERLVLVATSGDTGKAALAGLSDRPGVRVLVFYPEAGVSEIQRLQMLTDSSANAAVVGIRGNFDDAQRAVKALFADRDLVAWLLERGLALASANSINIARLLPQIVYYGWAWIQARAAGLLGRGEALDFVVPTGNFGDALAGLYARRLGLPVGEILVATNRNRVLADFFQTGRYDRNRSFFRTTSPSMDILAASNLERLLFELCGRDPERLSAQMALFASTGAIELSTGEMAALAREGISGGWASDEEAAATIGEVFASSSYLIDTHTAVAASVLKKTGGRRGRPTVILSTASPFKFPATVAAALGGRPEGRELATAAALAERAGLRLPEALSGLARQTLRHQAVVEVAEMEAALRRFVTGGRP